VIATIARDGVPRSRCQRRSTSSDAVSRAAAKVVREPAIRIAFIEVIEVTATIATIASCPGLPNASSARSAAGALLAASPSIERPRT
jgi:hypothetical protein